MIRLLSLLAALLVICCTCTEKLEGPHRRRDAHIVYYINKEANILSETAVRRTFEGWSEKTHFTFEYKGENTAGIKRDGKNTVSFMLRWPKNIPMGNTAYCYNWYDRRGNIVESDIILNMQITKFTTLQTNTPDSYYIEGVLAHEIGHMIGLDHIDSESSLMKEKSSAAESYFKGEIDDITLQHYHSLYD